MSLNLGFHAVTDIKISGEQILRTELGPFSVRWLLVTYTDGTAERIGIYGEASGIPVSVQEREAPPLAA
jgi:hypothetical protein